MPERSATASARIGALEEGYKNLGREIGGLREDFSLFARDVRADLGHSRRTQWSPIIAGVGVIVAVLGGLITLGAQGPLDQLGIQRSEIQEINNELDTVEHTIFSKTEARYTIDQLLKREDDMRLQLRATVLDVRTMLRAHVEDGHPHTSMERIDAISARLARLESNHLQLEIKTCERDKAR